MKPRIAVIADVKGWAWERKALQLQRHLGDDFAVDVLYMYEPGAPPVPATGYDLWHTFEVLQASRLPAGVPFVTGMTAHVWPTWEARFGAGTVRRWSHAARAFHANSRLLEAEMRDLLGREIAYVPNGVDEAFFRRTRPRGEDGRLVVGWVGKPNPRKGHAIVAEACRLAGVELRPVERRHSNALDPGAMREFYQDLHVIAVASDMDGTPNPALEAAACGVAVVSNRIGNMPEFVEPGVNGLLVERNAESMAAALRELAADLPGARAMGEAARATVEAGWRWSILAGHYGAMWRGALGR